MDSGLFFLSPEHKSLLLNETSFSFLKLLHSYLQPPSFFTIVYPASSNLFYIEKHILLPHKSYQA